MLVFAIKFKHGYCLLMGAICQLAAFALKIGGYLYADNEAVKIVTIIMLIVMTAFTLVPFGVFKYWYKIEDSAWLNKFDKDLKMNSYKK